MRSDVARRRPTQARAASATTAIGALMRCLPVVFIATSDDEAVDLAMRQGLPTHGHIRSQLCCAMYALIARRLLEGASAGEAVERAGANLRQRFGGSASAPEMNLVLNTGHESGRGSGYVLDSPRSAVQCLLTTSDFQTCLQRAVSLGNDTDTTATISGGLGGLRYGFDAIPERWITALHGRDTVDALLGASSRSR
ncbi:ADP-ribosylglycohydrolase family protein [Caballeronia sp. 15711]|uniref:ADP-ribosylglycohydrolase family protein n=1 Tax=Caballeronia sp. 15711 TaxID=3391029 RepID=UPI0039E4A4EC